MSGGVRGRRLCARGESIAMGSEGTLFVGHQIGRAALASTHRAASTHSARFCMQGLWCATHPAVSLGRGPALRLLGAPKSTS